MPKSCRNSSAFFVWFKFLEKAGNTVLSLCLWSYLLPSKAANSWISKTGLSSRSIFPKFSHCFSQRTLSFQIQRACVRFSKYGNPCALSLCQSSFSSPSRKGTKPSSMKDCLWCSDKGSLVRHCCPFSVGNEPSRPHRTMHQRAYTRLSYRLLSSNPSHTLPHTYIYTAQKTIKHNDIRIQQKTARAEAKRGNRHQAPPQPPRPEEPQ